MLREADELFAAFYAEGVDAEGVKQGSRGLAGLFAA